MINSMSPETMTHEDQPGQSGLSLSKYTTWLHEIQNQPAWRAKADKEMDYVDGNQLDSEILQKQREIGMPPAIEPLIGPAVDAVTGLEAKTRTDWRITADGDKADDDVAAALNFKVNQAERQSGADKACTDAFKPQLCVGIGWVEVARESDPFLFPYRCKAIHRNEIFWDMLDREPGLPKARYLVRRRWTDTEQVKLKFPIFSDLIDRCSGRWSGSYEPTIDGGTSTALAMSWEDERGWSIEEQEWRDAERGRVCLFEVWYRRWIEVVVIKLPDGRVIEYNDKLASHVIAVAQGFAKPTKAVVARMYVSFWMGPHRLYDGPTPYAHNDFPYVQFIGKTEDRTGVPFGVVRGMIYLQDNVNSLISKLRWGMSATRTTRTTGVVDYTDEQFRQQVSRVDADIKLNGVAMAKPGAVFKVERDFELNQQQFQLLNDSRSGIDRCSGITPSFKGATGTATSGVQESTQVEQTTQSLATLMDNFKFGRAKVGELLLSLIIQDMIGKQEKVVIKGTALRPDRTVELNVPQVDPDTGIKYLSNDVQRVRLKVAMNDVPSTPSFRTQQLAAMSEAFKSMPQEFQVVALPHLMSLMDVPNRDELIEDIKNAQQQATPEQVQTRIDEAVKLALERSDHGLRERELELKYNPDKLMAEIQKLVSEAVKNGVQSSYAAMQAGVQVATMPQIAPIADAVMQAAGYQAPTPGGDDPNFPIAGETAAVQMKNPYIQGQGPAVQQNTSPQLPPVPATAGDGMSGIETATPADNTV
ncbi:hypothetical protein [Polaromonas sp.]|uniref:portal protein n=1 Tax=Polaromonas sp. TaxID=1869339 RepID=UPI0032652CF3